MIAIYLRLFVYITKHGAYIDGFAGPQEPEFPEMWTARLVLESEPKRLKQFFLCEIDKKKIAALEELRQAEPSDTKREILIYKGDFNKIVSSIVQSGKIREKIATFCLLDQRTFECKWKTVETLARAKRQMKIELFYFVPTGWLQRSLASLQDNSVVRQWWGSDDWEKLKGIPSYDCANRFCGRFMRELEYKHAHAWPIFERKEGKRVMYFMVMPPTMMRLRSLCTAHTRQQLDR
jgi:three-Cys-motif partner protein